MKILVRISAVGGLALVSFACSSTSDAPTAQDSNLTGASSTAAPPDFGGGAQMRSLSIDVSDATQSQTSDAVAGVVQAMTSTGKDSQNCWFYATVYKFAHGDLSNFDDAQSCHARRNNVAYGVMFRSDGSTPQGDNGQGGSGELKFQVKWSPEFETMGCSQLNANGKVLDAAAAFKTFRKFTAFDNVYGDTTISAADRKAFYQNGQTVVGSILKDVGGAHVYKCHWDNTDDTNADAMVTVDPDSGEVRVVLAFAGA